MKHILVLSLALIALFPETFAQIKDSTSLETTTYYLIRHAEKDRSDSTNKNPVLTKKGFFRAERWSKIFSSTELDAIYSTNYDRTLMTASPTAKSKELEIQLYDPRGLYDEEFREATTGKTVLVVGHSNTTPAFVNAILGEDRYEDMDDMDNSSLYVVTKIGEQVAVQVLKMD